MKDWETNFLGNDKHNVDFSCPLESDTSFNNAIDHNTINYASVLKTLFDPNLRNNPTNKFKCIDHYLMNTFDSENNKISTHLTSTQTLTQTSTQTSAQTSTQRVEQTQQIHQTIKKPIKIMWIINRSCDCVGKPFFRFVLKKGLTETDISNLLYLLSDCSFEIEMGGSSMFKLNKLLFIFLICQKLNKPLTVFNVKNFLEQYSMEEIKKMIFTDTPNCTRINQKYYVEKSDDIYLDIPLLIDFFSYGISTPLIALQYHDVKYLLSIPANKINLLNKYTDKVVLMFEELMYSDSPMRKGIAQSAAEYIKMGSEMHYYHCWSGNLSNNTIICQSFSYLIKFIFIIIRQHETTNLESTNLESTNFDMIDVNKLDSDIDVSQFPQITEVELDSEERTFSSKRKVSVDLSNIWVLY